MKKISGSFVQPQVTVEIPSQQVHVDFGAPVPNGAVGPGIPRRSSSDLFATGPTIHVPAGYYEENAGKDIANATPASASSRSVEPTLSLDSSTGVVTAENNGDVSVSPIGSAGYATPELSHDVHVGGSKTLELPTKAGEVYTPTKNASQIISAGAFLTGDQVLSAIPDRYYDMSDPMSWLGKEVELLDGNVYTSGYKLSVTSFNGWTPSTTAKTIVASASVKTFEADLANYEYFLVWECKCDMAYTGSPTLKAHFLFSRAYIVQEIMKRPSTFANVQANVFDGNNCSVLSGNNFLRYYGSTLGSLTYSWATSYGIYFAGAAATFSDSTSDTPTVTIKSPTVSARCSTTYFSTGNAALVDQENSTYSMSGKLYRIKRNGAFREINARVSALIT